MSSRAKTAQKPTKQKRDDTWEEVQATIQRRLKAFDKILTQYILSDEYTYSSTSDRRMMCSDFFTKVTKELFLKHFDYEDVEFAAQGLIARLTHEKAKRPSAQVYIDLAKGNPE